MTKSNPLLDCIALYTWCNAERFLDWTLTQAGDIAASCLRA